MTQYFYFMTLILSLVTYHLVSHFNKNHRKFNSRNLAVDLSTAPLPSWSNFLFISNNLIGLKSYQNFHLHLHDMALPSCSLLTTPASGIVGGFGSVRHVASFEKALSFKLLLVWIFRSFKIITGLHFCTLRQ